MKNILNFGEHVPGYNIPVLNEREIRAAAGILFLMMYTTIMIVSFTQNFTPIKYSIIAFFIDISVRLFISPRFAPTLVLGRLIVRKQTPEYVGAAQKKFAWIIGFALALTMMILMVAFNTYSPITGIICLICLIFLFFESAFGICLGCKFYSLFFKEKAQYCPGEICEIKDRQEIQKTSKWQMLTILGFTALMFLIGALFHSHIDAPPYDLFGMNTAVHADSSPD